MFGNGFCHASGLRYSSLYASLVAACFSLALLFLSGCGELDESGAIQHTRDAGQPDVVSMATSVRETQGEQVTTPVASSPSEPQTGSTASGYPAGETVPASPTLPECAEAYFFEPAPAPCPDGPFQTSAAAEQPFERGFMIWFEAADAIYVFNWDGTWRRFEDLFVEGQEEFNPDIVPPAGMYQPIRGFGKVWRGQHQVRQELGWALGDELGFESAFQSQRAGDATPPVLFIRAYNGQVLALTTRDPGEGDWVVAAS